ncbi:hypothetical protein C7S18_02495 [Ahniella affigens]|uniref:Uncharacterized protein n=1 Tax=Ahniella affigens TaxID=2021234 RepID=A0A2P1PMR2_9GAMM|nr:DUF6289 family protein [Ahniella affigens]AVP96130.1 hypothetical protein C7S18_02495 [Ahniella affigens]
MKKSHTFLLSLAATMTIAAGVAYAGIGQSINRFYYSSAAHTEVVGEEFISCGGTRILDGVRTAYYTETRTSC